MYPNDYREHINKEAIKHCIDMSPNFSQIVKRDLKAIIDTSKTPEIAVYQIIAYFSTLR